MRKSKSKEKDLKNKSKKVLTNGKQSDILIKLSPRGDTKTGNDP